MPCVVFAKYPKRITDTSFGSASMLNAFAIKNGTHIHENFKINVKPNYENVILGNMDASRYSACNLIVLVAKQWLYWTRCLKKKTSDGLCKETQFIQDIELHEA